MRVRNKLTGEVIEIPEQQSSVDLYAGLTRPSNQQSGFSTQAPKPPRTLEGFGANVAKDVGNIATGVMALPAVVAKYNPGTQALETMTRTPQVLREQSQALFGKGEGTLPERYSKAVDVGMKASPQVEMKNMLWTVAKGAAKDYANLVKDPVGTFYDRPVSSTLDVLAIAAPIIKKLRATGQAKKAADIQKATQVLQKTQNLDKTLNTATEVAKNTDDLETAGKMYASAFVVPTKRGRDIQAIEASKAMIQYNIKGPLSYLRDVVDRVTGANGAGSRTVRNAIGAIPTEINIDDASQAVKNLGSMMTEVTDSDINKISRTIATKIPVSGQTAMNVRTSGGVIAPVTDISQVNALDAFDLAKQLERQARDFRIRSTVLTPNLRYEQLSKLYYTAASTIMDSITNSMKGIDVSDFKDADDIADLQKISPALADDFIKAKTIPELRSFQKYFVKLGQMIDMTEDAQLSVARKLGVALGSKLGLGVTGGILGGIPGAVVGALASPIIEPAMQRAIQSVVPRVLTGGATMIPKVAPITRAVGSTVKALPGVAKSGVQGALLRKLMQYAPQEFINQPVQSTDTMEQPVATEEKRVPMPWLNQ